MLQGDHDRTAAPEIEVLESHDDGRNHGRRWGTGALAVLLIVALAAVVGAVNLTRHLMQDPSWPTRCGVDGHAGWCADPSDDMKDDSLAVLAQAHCPSLSGVEPSAVVPQPFRLFGPSDGTGALVSGNAGDGSEEALLGRPGRVSWVTRYVGGGHDGRVRLSCPGAAGSTPGLQLEPAQLVSTVEAISGTPRRIDFGEVGRQLVAVARRASSTAASFGFLTCDTATVRLNRLRAGREFTCAVEVYGPNGRGSYRAGYRVADRSPYFRPMSG